MVQERILDMIESNRVEFKRELNDSLEKEVVGFLNYSEGGEIYIGIADDGTVIGIENADDLQKRIVDRIKNNVFPSTMGLFDVITTDIDGQDIIEIIISSGPDKPYYIKKYGMSPNGCRAMTFPRSSRAASSKRKSRMAAPRGSRGSSSTPANPSSPTGACARR